MMIRLSFERTALVAIVLYAALLCSACSFVIPIVVTNNSDDIIMVSYTFKGKYSGVVVPTLESCCDKNELVSFPEERLSVNFEKGIVEAKLLPGETMLIDKPNDQVIDHPDEYFNIESLRITSKTGILALEGSQVLANFRPIEKNFFVFGPKYVRYVLEYREYSADR